MLCGQCRVETARLGEASSLEMAYSTVDVPPRISSQSTVRIETEQMYREVMAVIEKREP